MNKFINLYCNQCGKKIRLDEEHPGHNRRAVRFCTTKCRTKHSTSIISFFQLKKKYNKEYNKKYYAGERRIKKLMYMRGIRLERKIKKQERIAKLKKKYQPILEMFN